jgi:bla regulator protein BlaR1
MTTFVPLANHLWQSTIVAALIALATLAFRRNRASVRHALWLAASIKFLVPFAALATLGAQFAPVAREQAAQPGIAAIIDSASRPFVASTPAPAPRLPRVGPTLSKSWPVVPIIWITWMGGSLLILSVWGIRWWRVASIVRRSRRIREGREVDALRRLERQAGIVRPMTMVESPASFEPGVFGIRTPVLLWPVTIGEHLNADQLVTILAHEVAHVRRRDNLAAVAQTLVEALFWFHPLVWWVGARLSDERERACDEEVLQSGGEPELYAETILTACRLYLQAPPSCVAGVASSNLRKRIERIMTNASTRQLTLRHKLLLATIAFAAVATPVAVGALTPRLPGQSADAAVGQAHFEVASVKVNKSGPGPVVLSTQLGGRFRASNVTLRMLVQTAYKVQASQIVDGPSWFNADRFDIVAKGDDSDHTNPLADDRPDRENRMQLMLRSLLADRFKLVVRTETRELPIYALILARPDGRLGEALHPSTVDCNAIADAGVKHVDKLPTDPGGMPPGAMPPCGIRIGVGSLAVGGSTLSQVATTLSGILDRTVVERTGLTGGFDATLKWTPDQATPAMMQKAAYVPSIDPNGPSIFTAVQEQLGLKLESTKGPVKILVIVRAEPPTEN